jgi:hypothetical protein
MLIFDLIRDTCRPVHKTIYYYSYNALLAIASILEEIGNYWRNAIYDSAIVTPFT